MVNLRPHRGALITSITPEDIRNYYELHGLLASYAAEKAATRMPTVAIDKMEALAQDLRKFSEQKNFSAMVETHNTLFEHFISVCENERLSSTICNLMRPFQRFRVMLSESESNLGAVEFYEEIIAAFRERDPQRAAFLAAKYSGDTSVSILRHITHGHTPNREE